MWQRPINGLQRLLVQSQPIPERPITELDLDLSRPIVYVLPQDAFSDRLALHQCCLKLGLPSPFEPLQLGEHTINRWVSLEPAQSLFGRRKGSSFQKPFEHLLSLHKADPQLDVQVVPVSLLWGRDPGKEESVSATILADDKPTWLRKSLIIAVVGRDNFIRFSRAVSMRYMAEQRGSDTDLANKLARVARVHFGRQRTVATGPKLPERNGLLRSLLREPVIQQAIADEAKAKNITEEKARQNARKILDEIAADYSEKLFRIGDRVLTWLWNKLYNGINVRGAEQVRQLAQDGHEIVYVPCHRSHMDYLLLSYVIYKQGLVAPHIAAGVNLNFWPAGPIFRRGGAFFIRRSFKGNKLYSTIFREYLDQLFKRGYSVEYFCEGGRSRTGRLLPPKTGMIAMTVNSVMRGLERPVTLVPVYLGYDHVMEVNSYHNELKGKKKEKESAWQVFSAIRKLSNYGQGYVNFGEPITLQQFLNQQQPDWRAQVAAGDTKHSWVTPAVNQLANQLMCHINDAAAASAMTLTASILLATEHHAMERSALERQLDIYLDLLRAVPYTSRATVPEGDGKAVLQHVLDLNKFERQQGGMSEIISLIEGTAVTMTYYRNNSQHLLVLPALIASLLLRQGKQSREQLKQQIHSLFPLLQAELFIGMNHSELDNYLDGMINELLHLQLLLEDANGIDCHQQQHAALLNLANQVQETIQRYAIVLSRLQNEPEIERGTLERESQQLAEHMSKLHGISAPEFFDKSLFNTLTNKFKDLGLLGEDADRAQVEAMTQLVLSLVAAPVYNSIIAVR
ncbi:glycerol-3-phosphate 1-O-acyltransferase PlsB [Ferrimonas senticii]|uniref:glycerol-3-phosphate 1-O-acyltransferase PlsB n=1 Tax=Ferrimonas senticii TaxID=394566 RepID=UPI00042939BC|nr:glycerol-3-phosphate 1-O-acyltransferase PlsB [Ferrimonas senticii]